MASPLGTSNIFGMNFAAMPVAATSIDDHLDDLLGPVPEDFDNQNVDPDYTPAAPTKGIKRGRISKGERAEMDATRAEMVLVSCLIPNCLGVILRTDCIEMK
jgi:hypothetical protein